MALFNETLVGRFDRLASRLHGMKGHAVHPQISPEIQHALVLELDRPEWKYLAGEMLCGAQNQAIAAPAQTSGARLSNPANSGVLVIVELALVSVSVASEIMVGARTPTANLASVVATKFVRDGRFVTGQAAWGAGASPTAVVSHSNDSAAGGSQYARYETASINTTVKISECFPLILGPNQAMDVMAVAPNNRFDWSFFWRERALEASET